jgi:hypothetical protein
MHMPQRSELRKPHALSLSVRLLENASSLFKYDINTPKNRRYTEDTQLNLKIHMSPSSAPDLRIAPSTATSYLSFTLPGKVPADSPRSSAVAAGARGVSRVRKKVRSYPVVPRSTAENGKGLTYTKLELSGGRDELDRAPRCGNPAQQPSQRGNPQLALIHCVAQDQRRFLRRNSGKSASVSRIGHGRCIRADRYAFHPTDSTNAPTGCHSMGTHK